MKKYLIIGLAVLLIAAIVGGCGDAKPTSASASTTPSPAATVEPVATTAPDVTATPANDEGQNTVSADGWTYYLNEEDAVAVNYGEDPPLLRKNSTGSDEDLDIRGFGFDIIGDYIYVDSNYPDLDENGNQIWYTTRMSLDGSEKRRLEYSSMSARVIPEGEQKFYFTTARESAVFVSDFSGENVTPLIVALPDMSELDQKLSSSKEMQMDINEIKDGSIGFDVTFLTAEGIQMYKGTYKMAEDGSGIEKVSGTYYDYKSLESDLD